jgi:hypothetical protein
MLKLSLFSEKQIAGSQAEIGLDKGSDVSTFQRIEYDSFLER